MRLARLVVPAVVALSFGVGCAHANSKASPQVVSDQHANDSSSQPQIAAAPDKPAASTPQEDTAHKALTVALQDMQNVKVFFNFDDSSLTEDGKQSLTKIADILTKNPRLGIKVAGNCDDRGTEAYNIALGQKRADAAKSYLTALGVQDSQVGTVSYGDERPAVNGHDESAWSQNRRDDIVVTTGAP